MGYISKDTFSGDRIRIVLEASQHSNFGGYVQFGRYEPPKIPISAIGAIFFVLAIEVPHHLQGGRMLSSSPYFSDSQVHCSHLVYLPLR